MDELFNIVRDVRKMETREIPGFLLWLIGRTFWVWFAVIFVAFVAVAVLR